MSSCPIKSDLQISRAQQAWKEATCLHCVLKACEPPPSCFHCLSYLPHLAIESLVLGSVARWSRKQTLRGSLNQHFGTLPESCLPSNSNDVSHTHSPEPLQCKHVRQCRPWDDMTVNDSTSVSIHLLSIPSSRLLLVLRPTSACLCTYFSDTLFRVSSFPFLCLIQQNTATD